MAAVSAAKQALLNRMNLIAKKAGLGDILALQSHKVIAAGAFTTLGGDANEAITVSGMTSSDVAIVTVKTAGATPRTVTTAAAASGQINVVLSGDPSTDHVLNYVVHRAL